MVRCQSIQRLCFVSNTDVLSEPITSCALPIKGFRFRPTRVQPPHGSPLLGGNWGWDEAYLDYVLSSPETGDWVQSSDH